MLNIFRWLYESKSQQKWKKVHEDLVSYILNLPNAYDLDQDNIQFVNFNLIDRHPGELGIYVSDQDIIKIHRDNIDIPNNGYLEEIITIIHEYGHKINIQVREDASGNINIVSYTQFEYGKPPEEQYIELFMEEMMAWDEGLKAFERMEIAKNLQPSDMLEIYKAINQIAYSSLKKYLKLCTKYMTKNYKHLIR